MGKYNYNKSDIYVDVNRRRHPYECLITHLRKNTSEFGLQFLVFFSIFLLLDRSLMYVMTYGNCLSCLSAFSFVTYFCSYC